MAVVVFVLIVGLSFPSWAVPPGGHQPATWNMQGGRDRWSGAFQLSLFHNVVALQEVPAVPPAGATPTRRTFGDIVEFRWREGSRATVRYLYMLIQDSRHLGMITHQPVDDAAAIPGNYRDLLGVVTNGFLFASAHASANGGSDAVSLIRRAAQYAQQQQLGSWAVLGDFNRPPSQLLLANNHDDPNRNLPAGTRVYDTGRPTQRSGRELDYMVSNQQTDEWRGAVLENPGSDHWPVEFGSLQAAAGPRELSIYSDSNGRLLDVERAADEDGTHVITYHPTGGRNQKWRLIPLLGLRSPSGKPLYRLISVDNGKCLDVNRGQHSGAGDYFNIWTCHGLSGAPTPGGFQHDTQNFTLESPVSEQPNLLMLRNNATGLYANVLGDGQGDGTWVGQWYDQQGAHPVANETFYLHPDFTQ